MKVENSHPFKAYILALLGLNASMCFIIVFLVVKSVICKKFIAKVVIYIQTSNRQLSLKSRSDKWSCSSSVILKYPQRVYWSWTLLEMRLWNVLLQKQNINIMNTYALWKSLRFLTIFYKTTKLPGKHGRITCYILWTIWDAPIMV